MPSPSPGPGEIVVDVAAAGVNFIDVYHRTGHYPPPAPLPFVPGGEGSGRVTSVGPEVDLVGVGDRVAWCQVPGGAYAEQILLKQGDAVPIDDDLADDVAAAVLVQGLTAHYLTKSVYAVGPGDTALVHTAAGGSGAMITQAVKLLRRPGHRRRLDVGEGGRGPGGRRRHHVVNYGTSDVAAEARRFTDGEGVSVVYDGTGQSTFESGVAALRRRGTMVLYGSASGPVPPVDVQRVLRGGLFLTRPRCPTTSAPARSACRRSTRCSGGCAREAEGADRWALPLATQPGPPGHRVPGHHRQAAADPGLGAGSAGGRDLARGDGRDLASGAPPPVRTGEPERRRNGDGRAPWWEGRRWRGRRERATGRRDAGAGTRAGRP